MLFKYLFMTTKICFQRFFSFWSFSVQFKTSIFPSSSHTTSLSSAVLLPICFRESLCPKPTTSSSSTRSPGRARNTRCNRCRCFSRRLRKPMKWWLFVTGECLVTMAIVFQRKTRLNFQLHVGRWSLCREDQVSSRTCRRVDSDERERTKRRRKSHV